MNRREFLNMWFNWWNIPLSDSIPYFDWRKEEDISFLENTIENTDKKESQEIKKILNDTKSQVFFWDEEWAFEESFWNC